MRFINGSWGAVLRRSPAEASTVLFHDLIPSGRDAAEVLLRMLLDPDCGGTMEFGIRCAGGAVRRFLWHRRFDPQSQLMYIAGEEIDGADAAGDGKREEQEPAGSRAGL